MSETRTQLLNRKLDLFAAIRQLDQDLRDGVMDQEAYADARRRYELEAAEVLERLDAASGGELVAGRASRRRLSWAAGGALVAAVAAIVLLLVAGTRGRTTAGPVTGNTPSNGSPTTQITRQVRTAQRQVLAHPRSAEALVALGNAYLQAGDDRAADQTYQRAMRLAPDRPEAATLHAMVLGADGKGRDGLAQLRRVEARHPGYAKAWLIDGLLASQSSSGRERAIASWTRFLALQPHSALASTVRQWLARTEKRTTSKQP